LDVRGLRLGDGQRRARLGRDAHEIRVDPEKFGEPLERGAEPCEAGRHRWLEIIVVEVTVLRAEKPAEVEGAEVAAAELGPHRNQRRREVAVAFHPVAPHLRRRT
jgi:hypothetical protein